MKTYSLLNRKTFGLLFAVIAVLSFSILPNNTSAQGTNQRPATSISFSELTQANGWTCVGVTKESCTNNRQGSPFFGATARCEVNSIPSPNPGIPDQIETTCTAQLANGSTVRGTTTDNSAAGTITEDRSITDASGETTSVSSETSESPANVAVDAIVGAYRCVADGPVDCLIDAVGTAVVMIATFFLGIAGVFFNIAVVKTVFGFSTLIGNSPEMLEVWGVLRDLANMLLLFGFIFIGVSTILNINTYSAKRTLPRLLIFAVLMNFSLFAAQAVIDVSNVLSAAMYNQANSDSACIGGNVNESVTYSAENFNGAFDKTVNDCALTVGIAGAFMSASGLSSLFDFDLGDQAIKNVSLHVALALFATIGAIVFMAAGIMLVIRAVVLTFLMITAPIGFAALAIPQLTNLGKQWWNKLISQAFFAPVMILLMLVSIKLAQSLGSIRGDGIAAAIAQPSASVMVIFLLFAMVMGFMLASIIAAQKLGAMGAGFAVNLGTKFAVGGTTRVINVPTNYLAGKSRAGIQRGALKVKGSNLGKRYAQSKFSTSSFGAGLNKAAAKAGKATVMNTVGKLENANLDARRISRVQKGLAAIGAGEAAKPSGEEATLGGMQEKWKNFRKSGDKTAKAYDQQVMLEQIMAKADSGDELTKEEKKFLAKKSVKELEELDEIKKGVRQLVENLSPKQFEGLMKSDKLKDGEKGKIREARYARLTEAAKDKDTEGRTREMKLRVNEVKGITKNMSKKDLEEVPPDLLQNEAFLESLSDAQRDDLAKSSDRTDSERAAIRNASKVAKFESDFDIDDKVEDVSERDKNRASAITRLLTDLSIPQIGKLDTKILTRPEIARQFTPGILMELQETKKLKPDDIKNIANAIKASGSETTKAYINPGGVGAAYWNS